MALPMAINNTAQLTLFALIMMRMSGFVLMNPIYGRNNIPMRFKAGFIFVLTLVIYAQSAGEAFEPSGTFEFGFLLIKEFVAGYIIGYVMQLFFFIISFSGFIMDYQMGLSMATVYDPQSNAQMAVTGSVLQTWFMLMFFAVDGHLALMKIMVTSAEIVPYGGILITQGLAARMIEIFLDCVEMGIRFSIPIIAAEMLVEVGIGILNKAVPQISVFVINIQIKLIVGLGLLFLMFSPIGEYLNKVMTTMMKTVQGILTFL